MNKDAQQDADFYGVGFTVRGERVSPQDVVVYRRDTPGQPVSMNTPFPTNPQAIVHDRECWTWLQCPHCGSGIKTIPKEAASGTDAGHPLDEQDIGHLHRWGRHIEALSGVFSDERALMCRQVSILLSRITYQDANPAQATPEGGHDERAAFEAAVCKIVPRPLFERSQFGHYTEIMVQGFWSIWQDACAALAASQQTVSPVNPQALDDDAERSKAWLLVCEALTAAVPDWHYAAKHGQDAAVRTIARLAQERDVALGELADMKTRAQESAR